MLLLFEECIIVFPSPSSISKKKMSRILLSIMQNFGCSSYVYVYAFLSVHVTEIIRGRPQPFPQVAQQPRAK
jgi:hypothetical protein